ncbi:MAG: hypothetical protein DSM107014_15375 [Gomphosphaeria aponina SAG 52.96 = DSM 107014]|uniref:Uncharacterized protein n=1 Tax=Gomphosphaeria aponina SAG 52.96 = DSM 107014 TaxID=1521640 RepID=A0A941GRX4_9CHRO|nr:hypothetical protein [Gomphosphaeria aponina SAG 52.96 = DSM 107014]
MLSELDEATKDILRKYKPALSYIGVDFFREDVLDAILNCPAGIEAAFQSTITYWRWKKQQHEKFEYPSAFLVSALHNFWQPYDWEDEYLNDSNFKSAGQVWYSKAAEIWGKEVRDYLVADVAETNDGEEYILFMSGGKLSLKIAQVWGWERVLDYAKSSVVGAGLGINYGSKPELLNQNPPFISRI